MSVLNRVGATRSQDRKTTVFDFVVSQARSKGELDTNDFRSECPSMEEARKVTLSDIAAEFRRIGAYVSDDDREVSKM